MSIYFQKVSCTFFLEWEEKMKRFVFWLMLFLFFYFAPKYFFGLENENTLSPLSDLSLQFWENWMQNPVAREIFDLEEAEAKEVFGENGKSFFV